MYPACTSEFPVDKSRREGKFAPLGRATVLISRNAPKIASWLPRGTLVETKGPWAPQREGFITVRSDGK
jgi:hypothetical protein